MDGIRRQKVLIVDGDRHHAQILSEFLEAAGYLVFAAGRGEDTIPMLLQTQPQLVILNWNLADMSALTVTRAIHRDPRFATLPIVLLGREIGGENKVLSLEAGADLCLDGIVPPNELAARLRALLRRVGGPAC